MQGPSFANRIIGLASQTTLAPVTQPPPSPPPSTVRQLTAAELAKCNEDTESINRDLQLLSALLGRKVTIDDLPNLTKTVSSSTTTTRRPAAVPTAELSEHSELAKTRVKSAIVSDPKANLPQYYGKTDDAILASVLKQQGIGPAHNNIPITELLRQGQPTAATPYTPSMETPRPAVLQQQQQGAAQGGARPRPIIDGLAWLWRTWQDTAPRRPLMTLSAGGARRPATTTAFPGLADSDLPRGNRLANVQLSPPSADEGLDPDAIAVSLIEFW